MIRNAMIAGLHAAAHKLGLDDEACRDKLEQITGARSCRDLSDDQLREALKKFRPRAELRPHAAKAKAIWVGLFNLGAVTGTDAALDAFAARQTGAAKLSFVGANEARKLTEALKSMAAREGWIIPSDDPGGMGARIALVLAQWQKLAAAGAVRIADEAALMHWAQNCHLVRAFASPRQWKRHELDLAAKKLGQWLRKSVLCAEGALGRDDSRGSGAV